MTKIQIASNSVPTFNVPLAQQLVVLLSRMSAMGVLPGERIVVLDPATVRRAFGALQRENLFSTAAIDIAPLLRSAPADLNPAEAERMGAAVERLIDALGESPVPGTEWGSMRQVLGDAPLAKLVGVSESSLRRYGSSARSTPQDVAERLHWVAMVVADLAGAYNDFGIRRWFERPRPQLGGLSPRQVLGEKWHVDDAAAAGVQRLAAALRGAQPLAA